jgi:hypothetical protein
MATAVMQVTSRMPAEAKKNFKVMQIMVRFVKHHLAQQRYADDLLLLLDGVDLLHPPEGAGYFAEI